jgi:rhodanese-related sulfurtransferase
MMIKNVTLSQFVTLLRSEMQFKLIDVTSEDHYQEHHIPGAVSMPSAYIERLAPVCLEKNELLVVYGEDIYDETAQSAAERLQSLGFTQIILFPGGLEDYRRGMLPLGHGYRKAASI